MRVIQKILIRGDGEGVQGETPQTLSIMKRTLAAITLSAVSILATATPSLAQYYNYNSYGTGSFRTYSGTYDGSPFYGSTYTSRSGRWGSYNGYSGGRSYGGTCWRIGNTVSCSSY